MLRVRPHSAGKLRTAGASARPQGLAHVYKKGRTRRFVRDIYDAEHGEGRQGGRFRWLISTCLAATVGAIAILVVIYGSADPRESGDGLIPALRQLRDSASAPQPTGEGRRVQGLKWSAPRSDKLQISLGGLSTRYIIHESHKGRRDGREYIRNKPYARITARLSTVPADYADVIPPFNPFKLYASSKPVTEVDDDGSAGAGANDVAVKVVELLGGILPGEDGQELDNTEVVDLIARSQSAQPGDNAQATQEAAEQWSREAADRRADEFLPPLTTVLAKTTQESDEPGAELDGREVRIIKVGRGDTLHKILMRVGADNWHARSMADAAKSILPDAALEPGLEIHVTLVPSLTQQGRMEPAKFSVFGDGHDHKATVLRNAAGEFVSSGTPFDQIQVAAVESDQPTTSSLYASVYHAGLMQNIPQEVLHLIMRVHASDTDFRRRLRAGDGVEFFFDLKEDASLDGPPGDLLFTSINTGGEISKFWRFRSSDGGVDYYDEQGNNSRKFLMRRPVRGDDVRLTSGYGVRFHPLLNERKMHTGIDWAAPPGTPIMAAGNGVIEEAGRKGQYGNYVRIRHANGYQTTYAHMLRFANGVQEGAKVRQGQIIGYVGTTGLSSGPHLHYEVLVSNRFVDPMSIQVPREKKLEGKDLAEFQKERARIDDLMRRAPVMTKTASR